MVYNALHIAVDSLKQCTIIGLGRVGGWMAVRLAQSGIKRFVLIDGDKVDESNLSPEGMTPYSKNDVGEYKTDALARLLIRNFNGLRIGALREYISHTMRPEALDRVFGESVVIIWSLDSRTGLSLLQNQEIVMGRISIIPAMHVGGGGHVCVYIPFRTPCPLHTFGLRSFNDIRETEARRAGVSVRDMKAVIDASADIVRSLLFRGFKTRFCSPDFGESNYLHIEKLRDGRYRKIWLRPRRNPNCLLCGLSLSQ